MVKTNYFRVMLRLFIFQTTGQRMTLSPPHLQRDIDPQTLAIQPQEDNETWVGKRTGIRVKRMKDCFQTNSKSTDVTDFLLSRKLTADMLRKPDQMVTVQKNISKLGELMYILRPLIYGKLYSNQQSHINLSISDGDFEVG